MEKNVQLKYRLFRRRNGIFYWQENDSSKQATLRTNDRREAERLLNAMNESHREPTLNLNLARAYLAAHDPKMAKRTWQAVMDEMATHGIPTTQARCARGFRSKAYDPIRTKPLVLQCPDFPECLLQVPDCIFLLGNIQRIADQSRDLAVLDDWLSRAVDNPFSLFGMVNTIRHVDANVLAKDSLERFGYEIAIVRMQNGQPFRECRNAFRRIETEENERLRRPIIECSVRPERPASHVRESFSFAQIKFASLQLLCTPPELFFSALAVLDVDTRSKPLHYLPLFVMKRYV